MSQETDARADGPPRARLDVDISFLARLAVTLVFIALTLWIAAPFLSALTWALVLAVVFSQAHGFIERWLHPSIAAALSVLIVALIVVAPLLLVSQRLIEEAIVGAYYIQGEIAKAEWPKFLAEHPWLQRLYELVGAQIDLPAILQRLSATIANAGATVVRQSTGQVLTVALAFYLLFFFLRDRAAGLQLLTRLSPFSDAETNRLVQRAKDTIYAIIYGTLVVAALQGALGGFMFWWLGFPAPAFWSLIMGLLSIVPVLGTFVVWIPATIFLAIEGRWTDAATLAVWGGVVIASADNLVRPLLIGESVRLHTVPTFIALLGGLYLFGASGIVLGPIAMTLTALTLEFWAERAAAVTDRST
ncbi:MAG: AI-2E family transporter [Methylocystis sp.]|nr:AI-2E family transporter [Methylocystis sp.]